MLSLPDGVTILGVWAHPDDETYLSAGLMAAAIERGSRVVCVTATRGELGSSDPVRWPPGEPLAAVRTEELMQALGTIGITEHHWLDYPDGGCVSVDWSEAVARITSIVNEVRPDVVLTFGPDGMTGHDDHQTVSGWVTDSVASSSVTPQIFHAIHTVEWMDAFKPGLDELGVFMGFEPPTVLESELDLRLLLEGAALDRKIAAISAQVSQTQVLFDAVGEAFMRDALAEEAFVHA